MEMALTKFWLEAKFKELNGKCMAEFGMELPMPTILVNNSRRAFGFCCYRPKLKNPHIIKISKCHNRTPQEIENTLLHEMIHLYFNVKGMRHEGHGRNFQRMARQMDKYGYNIHTTSSFDYTRDKEGEIEPISMIKFILDDKVWLCAVCDKHYTRFANFIKNSPRYTEVEEYTTTSKMFVGFPRCRTRISTKETYTKEQFKTNILPYLKSRVD